MATFRLGVAAAVVGLVVAGTCLGQTVNPRDPASVQAWRTAQAISDATTTPTASWLPLGAMDDGIITRGIITPPDATTHQAVAGMRIEHFVADGSDGGPPVLSELDTFAVDCAAMRVKALAIITFARHNLTGQVKEDDVTDTWAPIGKDYVGVVAQAACQPPPGPRPAAPPPAQIASTSGPRQANAPAQTDLVAQPPRAPPPFDFNSEIAAHAWMQKQGIDLGPVDNPDWLQLGWTSDGIFLLRNNLDEARRQSRVVPRAVERLERFAATPSQAGGGLTLSETLDYDVNCNRKLIRLVKLTEYANRNTSGQATVKNFTEDFKPLGSDVMLSGLYQEICVVADQELDDTAGKFQYQQ